MAIDLTAGKMVNRNRHLAADVGIISNGKGIVPCMPLGAQQALSGAGAVTVTEFYSALTSTSTDAWTLADGTMVGQLKKVQMIVDGGTSVLTPSNLTGGTTITFADAGDYCLLMWDGASWRVLELGNGADGATAPALA